MEDYTLYLRLCDDDGWVSHQPADAFGAKVVIQGGTYLERLNNLRALTAPHGEHKPVPAPFVCTGSAHLADEHIKCTSVAHHKSAAWESIVTMPEWRTRQAESLVREVLVAVATRDGLSLESSAEPGTPARNYELGQRLGIGHVFGLVDERTDA